MKKAIVLLLVLLPLASGAKDILFNRLNKLYGKDQKKCLETAQRYINLFPENPSAYYFSSRIYEERSHKSKTVQGKYRNIHKAVGYAIQFEERDSDDMASDVNWDDFKADLTTQARSVLDQMDKSDLDTYGAKLLAGIRQLDENVEVVLVTTTVKNTSDEDKATEALTPAEVIHVDENSTIRFFGLPSGMELVESADPAGEQKVLALVNDERQRLGLEPLEWNEDLAHAARYHAYDLATQDYFDHSSYDRVNGELKKVGGTFDRIRRFYSASFTNSENIAAGNDTAEETYEQWYNSKGHYENMFNPSSKKVGIGVFRDENSTYGYYWVFCTAH